MNCKKTKTNMSINSELILQSFHNLVKLTSSKKASPMEGTFPGFKDPLYQKLCFWCFLSCCSFLMIEDMYSITCIKVLE